MQDSVCLVFQKLLAVAILGSTGEREEGREGAIILESGCGETGGCGGLGKTVAVSPL